MRQATAHHTVPRNRSPRTGAAREDRPTYRVQPLAALVDTDRDDVLRNLREAEALLRESLPELVLRLRGPGDEFLIGAAAEATTKVSSALRAIEERVDSPRPPQGHD